jgi:cytochrome c556
MLRGRIPFDGLKFAEGAAKLDALSHEPWKHFPQVREEDHTSAKDDVWQKQAQFQEMARNLEAATGELVIASQVQPYKVSNLGPAVQKVEDACSACHKQFRDH